MTSVAAKDVLGRYGEDLATRHLQHAGFEVLARNWRPDRLLRGELDIVARAGRRLVFCEVKTRRSTRFGPPAEAVSAAKQARIRRLAGAWLGADGRRWDEIRFDVIAVLCPSGGDVSIEHLRGVF